MKDSTDADARPIRRAVYPLCDFPYLEPEFVLVVARGFYRDPYMHGKTGVRDNPSAFGPNDQKLRSALKAFVRYHLFKKDILAYFIADIEGDAAGILRGGCIWCVGKGGSTWRADYINFCSSLKWGLRKDLTQQLDRLHDAVAEMMSDCIESDRLYYDLMDIAVDPQSQSKGYGSDLLRPMLDLADARSVPCSLESSNPRNVPFYERLGFRAKSEITIFESTVTVMRREPVED